MTRAAVLRQLRAPEETEDESSSLATGSWSARATEAPDDSSPGAAS
jgi:hypothetical protein